MTKTMMEEWEIFWNGIKPDNPSHIQFVETRRAFYAGALTVFTKAIAITSINGITGEQMEKEFWKLQKEVIDFLLKDIKEMKDKICQE